MRRMSVPEAARALGAAVTTSGLALALAAAVPDRTAAALQPQAPVDALVLALVLATAALAATALATGCCALLLTTLVRATGRRALALERAARALTPVTLRRVVAAGVGVGLGLGGITTATAADGDLGWQPTTTTAGTTGGTETVDVTSAAVPTATMATAPVPAVRAAPDVATTTVRPGDTLWDLAAAQLGPEPTDSEIAAAWPRWHEENLDVIGSDPDLLLPGQVLRVPAPPLRAQDTADAAGPTR